MLVGDGGEMQNEINKVWIQINLGAQSVRKELVAYQFVKIEFFGECAGFFTCGGLYVNPNDVFVCVTRNHYCSVYHSAFPSARGFEENCFFVLTLRRIFVILRG